MSFRKELVPDYGFGDGHIKTVFDDRNPIGVPYGNSFKKPSFNSSIKPFPIIPFGDPVHLDDSQTDWNTNIFVPTPTKTTAVNTFTTSVKTAEITVSGLVLDNYGNPMPDASVHIVSDSKFQVGTVTDFDGNFSIKAMPSDVLEVNYLGFAPQTFTASSIPQMIRMQEAENQLDEIVIDLRTSKDDANQSGSSNKKGSFFDKIKTEDVLIYGGIGLGVLGIGYILLAKPKKKK